MMPDPKVALTGSSPPEPKLFGLLPPGLFGVFHRASRTEYARIVLEIWRSFYSDPLQDHPSAKDIAAFVDSRLRESRAFIGSAEAETPGQGAYRNLVEAGWLAPYPWDCPVLVDTLTLSSEVFAYAQESSAVFT